MSKQLAESEQGAQKAESSNGGLHILLISHWDFQDHGMQVIKRTVQHFGERGHRVTFMVHPALTANPTYITDINPNVEVLRFKFPFEFLVKIPKVGRVYRLLLFGLCSFFCSLKRCRGSAPDVVYGAECDGIFIASWIQKVYGVPLITRYYGISDILLRKPLRHLLYSLCLRAPADLAIVTDDGTNDVADIAHIEEPCPYGRAIRRLADIDILVIIEAKCSEGIFLPSKFIDYVQTGRPILAVSPARGTLSDVISSHEGGLLADCTRRDEVAAALTVLYRHWQEDSLDSRFGSAHLLSLYGEDLVVSEYARLFSRLGS